MESVEHGEVTLAGDAEQVVHSVELELIHHKLFLKNRPPEVEQFADIVLEFADHVCVMAQGRVRLSGAPKQVRGKIEPLLGKLDEGCGQRLRHVLNLWRQIDDVDEPTGTDTSIPGVAHATSCSLGIVYVA